MSVDPWLVGSVLLLAAIVPCGVVVVRGDPSDRLVGLEMAAIVTTLLLVALAQASRRPGLFDLPLALALLAFGGAVVFARFLERWL